MLKRITMKLSTKPITNNMTPKEKAKEIIMKMSFETHAYNAKHCALIAVDEMYNIAHNLDDMATVGYLVDVKTEIEKL